MRGEDSRSLVALRDWDRGDNLDQNHRIKEYRDVNAVTGPSTVSSAKENISWLKVLCIFAVGPFLVGCVGVLVLDALVTSLRHPVPAPTDTWWDEIADPPLGLPSITLLTLMTATAALVCADGSCCKKERLKKQNSASFIRKENSI